MTLTIHHLCCSQSERIIWLCEELGIPYELKTYNRDPYLAPAEYKALHPAGTAPVIHDSEADLTLAESAACVEYICRKFGNSKLLLSPDDAEYAEFLYWFHWANGTFQPTLGRPLVIQAAGLDPSHPLAKGMSDRFKRSLSALDERLRGNKWLAGSQFTAADIMVMFSLTTMRYFYGYSLAGYDGILKYLQRIGAREAYIRAMKKGDPEMELALGAEPPVMKAS
ncbi:glutathione S-transferase [Cercophora newfieldiana]|uniref:Glutathione S-transferase n=1 Tax=Cercophora newfieldiana TaxID=92897 RepID=A0AA39Y384_9PEZI|nr:glutathione S-transferase [Cercophora newfieldiana]